MADRPPFVSFLSDYGRADEFVGVCHAVMLDIAPTVRIVDITHDVPAFDVRAGALALVRAVQYLPEGVVLAVVDPGVGSDRRCIAVAVENGYLVGPDNGLLAPELAAGITRIKGVKSKGVRVGNWLSIRQAQTLLNTPDVSTKKGLRDRAMLAILLGCGLRRSEVAALTLRHIQQRDSRWCIVDLVGKHGRVRTIPMPTWVKVAIDSWTSEAELVEATCCGR